MASALMCRTDFPLYTVRSLDDRYFLVAGGGGQVKTGVKNAIELYELQDGGGSYIASSLYLHETGSQAVMNSHSYYDGRNHTLAAGLDDECHLYTIKYKVMPEVQDRTEDPVNQEHVEGLCRRSKSLDHYDTDNIKDTTKTVTLTISEISQTTTDLSVDGAFQKAVRFSPNNVYIGTGGADGHLRIWKYPGMTQIQGISAHDCEIDDLDFSIDNKRVVTVGMDGTARVWNVDDGSKFTSLSWMETEWEPYRCRACRYGTIKGKQNEYNLYTIEIPSRRRAKRSQCYLTRWSTDLYKVLKSVRTGNEILSALAVSQDGIYVGIGTISGSVAVYISFSLQKVYNVQEVHAIFVTGLDFIPCTETSQSLKHTVDCSLLSVSADNTVRLHQVPSRGTYSLVWAVVGALILILLFFWLLGELSHK